MPTTDKLRGLLSKQERKVPDVVRLKEMNEVRNYNRNQQQKVYDSSLQQVSAEKESIKPASAKDVGSAFKLQVYILKLNQILQLKQETYTSLTTSLQQDQIDPAVVAAAARGDQVALRAVRAAQAKKLASLRGTRDPSAALATQFFSKAELLSSFNEMMAFIKMFMPGLTSDNRQKEQVYSSYLQPMDDLLKRVMGLYPAFFENVPEPRAPGRGIDAAGERQTYELMRQQSMYMYALLGTMAEFLDDENLRPIVAQDVSLFIKENNIRDIFVANPLAGNLRSREVQANIDAQGQAIQVNNAAQQAQAAELQARQQALADQLAQRAQQGIQTQQELAAQQALPGAAAADVKQMQKARKFPGLVSMYPQVAASSRAAVEAYVPQMQQRGIPNDQIFKLSRFTGTKGQKSQKLTDEIRFVGNINPSDREINITISNFRMRNPGFGAPRGRPQQGPPINIPPGQQGGPAGPAYATQPGGVLTRTYLDAILAYEQANVGQQLSQEAAFAALPQALQQEQIQAHGDEQNAIRDGLGPMLQQVQIQRDAFAQANGVDAGTLIGQGLPELKKFVEKKGMFPSKMNPKHIAHFMKLSIPPEAIFKLMKKHGLRDGALMEEMEGSGIFDDIMHYGSKAFDSVKSGAKDVWKGVKDSVKDALPSMSDVRRGVGSVVPDQYQKHLPDALKTTMFDKAKSLFGFGASEAGGIPDRHREPFSAPNLDKYGYRQGAAERMRIMPVDMELASGLHRLRGGDELRDTDVEVLRRQDHHDIDVPVAHDQPMHGYGVDGDEDDGMQGGLKQRLMGMPLAMFAPRGGNHRPFIPMFSGGELDPYSDHFEGGAESFYEEEEKPHDHDENPTPFRVRDENYKVNTGRLKKVTYKE
jgi:hypothetical protein|nr:MAG: hypothetical protein [Lake Baikal virophage 4]